MAWSNAARAAAKEARMRKIRQSVYSRDYGTKGDGVHVNRQEMARMLREARSTGLRGRGKSVAATAFATNTGKTPWKGFSAKTAHKYYTNVKGAHFVDQGLGGTAWRYAKNGRTQLGATPSWAAKKYKFSFK